MSPILPSLLLGLLVQAPVDVPPPPDGDGEAPATEDVPAPSAEFEPMGWRYDNGVLWEDPTSPWRLRLNGRLWLDTVHADEQNGSAIRSLRLQARVWFGEHWFLRAQGEFSEFDTDFKELYLEGNLDEDLGFRAGQFREPMGLDGLTPLPASQFPERSSPSQAFAPGRNPGFIAMAGLGPVRTHVGAFGEADEALNGDGTSRAVTGRIWGYPLLDEEANRGLHLGLSAGYRDGRDGSLRFRARPGSNLLDRTIDTGELPGAVATTLGLEALWLDGPLNLQAEAFGSHVDLAAAAGSGDLWGASLSGGWVLTGEQRAIDPVNGWLRRLRPRSGGTAWELAARAAYTDLDGGAISGGEQLDLAAGVNLVLARRLRVMLHLQDSQVQGGDDVRMLLLRVDMGF